MTVLQQAQLKGTTMANTDATSGPNAAPKLVVGFDYTESAVRALDQAARFCSSWPSAEVIVVHCTSGFDESLPGEDGDATEARLLKQLTSAIADHFAQLESSGAVVQSAKVTAQISSQEPAKAIPSIAFLEGADLILVGKSNKTGLERLVLGSVAQEVLKKAPCSVLVCRDRLDQTGPQIEPPLPAGGYASHLGRRHTYHHASRNAEARETMPLVFPMH